MDRWTVGLIAVVIIGLVLIIYGALSDRARNKRAAVQMLAPPARSIPQFRPDAPAPKYLSELQARRRLASPELTQLSQAEREQIAQQLKDPTTAMVEGGYLSPDFVTDPPSGWAVLDGPRVLVCADPIQSIRELLPVLEMMLLSQTPLVISAPALARDVQQTLEVNAIQRTLPLLAVAPSGATLHDIAGATQASILGRSDLQAGYVLPEHLGRCARWVSTEKESYLIGATAPEGQES